MDTIYSLSVGVLELENNDIMVTYGIVAKNSDGEKISEFSDVSINKAFTEKVIDLLNLCKVEPCHFYDVVIDEINR